MKKRRQWNTKYFQISKIYTSGIQKNSKKTNRAAQQAESFPKHAFIRKEEENNIVQNKKK